NLGDFIKTLKRDIGAALLVKYESLANDREGVNFTSIRDGTIEDRDMWRILQLFFVEHWYHRIFQNWLKESMLTGEVQLSVRDYLRLRDLWKPRGWDWVNPLQDIQAFILAMMNNVGSEEDYCDQRGDDAYEIIRKRARFKKAAEAAGLVPNNSALAPA